MLRRASVTIYMTQDIDTLGKDSELAATLAQGNIVIAYVESTTVDELTARFRDAPTRATSRLGTEPRLPFLFTCQTAQFVPAARFLRPGFAFCFAHPE